MENGICLECAECESERAQVVCCSESLAYCIACSDKIHSKKARHHHMLLPIPPCSRCLILPAMLQCFQCSQSRHKPSPAILCANCSTSVHSSSRNSVHSVTPLAVLASVIYNDGQFRIKQENADSEDGYAVMEEKNSEDGYAVMEEKKKKRRRTNDSKIPQENPPAGSLNMKIEEEPKIPSGNTCKREAISPPKVHEGRRRNTPRAATRRVFGVTEIHCSSSESTCDSDDNSDETMSDFEEESGVRRINRGSVSVEAFVVNADDEEVAAEGNGATENPQSVAGGIKERIRKMLELGLHPDTPDIEAQQALKNAQRLLTKHNLQQAEVMKGSLKDSSTLAGGMRVVELKSKGRIERVGRIEQWVVDLAHVIADNFDTQYFTRKYTRLDRPLQVVFYGIKQNADCSGYAFAATFNRITVMSANYNPSKNLDAKEKEDSTVQSTYTRIARNNYKLGIVAGLREAMTGENWEGEQEEEEDEDESQGGSKGRGMRLKAKEKKRRAMHALVVHSKEVGEAFIKNKGIKIRIFKSRLRESAWNLDAFAHGKIDSKHIDINQKALPTPAQRKNRPKRND